MERRKQSSSRKRQDVDRLSSLPDSILCYILSFLPTKSSAATSILARRWRFLWADVPNIDLDFQSYRECNEKKRTPISEIINRILFHCHNLKALNTFRLKHTSLFAKDRLTQHLIKSWIAAVTRHGKVRNIELEFTDLIMMPECLFAYKSLVELRLYRCEIRISEAVSLSFPSLEKLHLCFVKYNNDDTFQHLISGCSILEELVMKYLIPGDLDCYTIFSSTLKSLTIESGFHRQNHTVEIITPALLYLQLNGSPFSGITAQVLSSLIEADLNLVIATNVVLVHCVSEFLDRMSSVKRLKFEVNYEELLLKVFSVSSTRFHSLTKLELVAAGWPLMLKFLKIADKLQVLIISWDPEDFDECWVEPQEVITCLQSHLKSIVIDSFWWAEYELSMVRYLLKNAKVLTSMKIHCQVTVGCDKGKLDAAQKEKSDAIQRISLFERGSKTCKLDVN